MPMDREHSRRLEKDDSLPRVIYIPEATTLLSRWDAGCDTAHSHEQSDPPRAPHRSQSPPPSQKADKCREASRRSAIDIAGVPLVPVSFASPTSRRAVVPMMECKTSISEVIELQNRQGNSNSSQVTAVFCIRREGCGACRDHGLQLNQLSQQFPNLDLFGVIKKSAFTDDKALEEFYSKYFPFPIYQDERWDTFRFLGNRKISLWKTLKSAPRLLKDFKEKGIKNAGGGDHFTQGGVLLFDRKGQLRYIYYERFGDELDMEALRWAIQDCCDEPAEASNDETMQQLGKEEQAPPQEPPAKSYSDTKPRRPGRTASRPRRHMSVSSAA